MEANKIIEFRGVFFSYWLSVLHKRVLARRDQRDIIFLRHFKVGCQKSLLFQIFF